MKLLRSPVALVAAGAVAVVILLGITGNLYSVPPVDRLLNPDARSYWQSEDDYLREIVEHCSGVSDQRRLVRACIDSSIDGAVERGDISSEGGYIRLPD